MPLIRYQSEAQGERLGLAHDAKVYDLTASDDPDLKSLSSLLCSGLSQQDILAKLEEARSKLEPAFTLDGLIEKGKQQANGEEVVLLPPVDQQEIWASGVTYKRSEEARKAESEGAAQFYALVYEADRPELFFKATPHRTVGGHDQVAIREDARWNVPEPELGIVLTRELEVVGYTVGNDMSSRDIEGANPLYLPQAKVYNRCCAVGPVIALTNEVQDPGNLRIELEIERGGKTLYHEQTSTGEMHRTFEDLIAYLGRSNSFPQGVILLTGTGLVPGDDFTLEEDDVIHITIEGIGRLTNTVIRV